MSETLREQGKDKPAQLAEQAARRDRGARLATCKESDADRILSDVEDFARKQPMAVIAGGIALGFFAIALPEGEPERALHSRARSQLPNTPAAPAGHDDAPRPRRHAATSSRAASARHAAASRSASDAAAPPARPRRPADGGTGAL